MNTDTTAIYWNAATALRALLPDLPEPAQQTVAAAAYTLELAARESAERSICEKAAPQ